MAHPPDGALRLPCPEVRESVIISLQATASNHPPGTVEHDEANLAITLALSPCRSAPSVAYLLRNVTRDARRIHRHRPRQVVFFSALGHTTALNAGGEDRRTLEECLPASRHPRPDELAAADELQHTIRKAVTPVPHGQVCLDAMLENEPPQETALRLGIPVHQVHRARARVRERARRVLA